MADEDKVLKVVDTLADRVSDDIQDQADELEMPSLELAERLNQEIVARIEANL